MLQNKKIENFFFDTSFKRGPNSRGTRARRPAGTIITDRGRTTVMFHNYDSTPSTMSLNQSIITVHPHIILVCHPPPPRFSHCASTGLSPFFLGLPSAGLSLFSPRGPSTGLSPISLGIPSTGLSLFPLGHPQRVSPLFPWDTLNGTLPFSTGAPSTGLSPFFLGIPSTGLSLFPLGHPQRVSPLFSHVSPRSRITPPISYVGFRFPISNVGIRLNICSKKSYGLAVRCTLT